MNLSDLTIKNFILSNFEENAYMISLKGSKDAVLIDPGLEPEKMINTLQKEGINIKAILITHGHLDHIAGIPAVKKIWPDAKIVIGDLEKEKLTDPDKNLSGLFGIPFRTNPADVTLNDGDQIELAGIIFKALLIPGHSCGHMAYIPQTKDQQIIFSGDILFSGGIGRTDFPDGDSNQLISGIKNKMFTLPDETVVYSGHGLTTTIGREKIFNSWIQ